MSDSFHALIQQLRQFSAERDWEPFHSPKNLAMALSVEASELLEHFQWLTETQSQQLDEEKKQEVAYEMADVLLYLLRMADQLNIDLCQSAQQKMEINAEKYPVEKAKGRAEKYNRL